MRVPLHFGLLGLIILAVLSSKGQGSLDQTFLRRYNLQDMQGGLAITTSPDGGFIATGQHQNNGSAGGCDVYVYKVDACGNREWFNLYGGEESEGGKSIEPTADGGYIIGGSRATLVGVDGLGNNITEDQGFVMKLGPVGELEWYNYYNDVAWIFDVQPLASGYIAIGQASSRALLLKLDDAGNVLWAKRYPSLSKNALMVTPLNDGGFLFVTNQPMSGRDVEVARVDALGNPIWMKSYGAGFEENEHIAWGCNALVDEVTGEAYIMGATTAGGIGEEDILLMKLDISDGSIIWSRALGSLGDDLGRDLIFVPGGLALLGSSNGYGAAASDYPEVLSQSMEEHDILLAKLNPAGFVQWAQTYGGNERDKAVGVRFDSSLGYTISAYTSSSVFGNSGGSMDPLFIRADLDGTVSCQNVPVTVVSLPVAVSVNDLVSSEVFITQPFSGPITVSSFEPEDEYQCQQCFNEPQFELDAALVCLGDTVTITNTTELGLRCHQFWEVSGPGVDWEPLPGTNDTLRLVMEQSGVYDITLATICGGAANWSAEIEVFDVQAEAIAPAPYSGYEVSCPDATDGSILEGASGGYIEGGAYSWQWQASDESIVDTSGLGIGTYKGVVTDLIGCTDTIEVLLTSPTALSVTASVVSDFNGYAVRCADSEDGSVLLFASGGIPNYAFPVEGGVTTNDTLTGLAAGENVFTVVDANGCLAQDTVYLAAPAEPLLILSAEPDTCLSGEGELRAAFAVDVPPASIIWPDGFGVPVPLTAFSEQQSGVEAGVYEVELLDGNGCLSTVQVEVPATYPSEVVFLTGPEEVCFPGADVDFQDLTADSIASRRWSFGDGDFASRPGGDGYDRMSHTYLSSGYFDVILTVVNGYGCTSEASQTVEVIDGMTIFVPSAFTPDNDGLNDGFGPVMTGVESFHMWIFDRWGDPVFETEDEGWWWNGSPENKGLSHKTELFTWRLEAQGSCDAFRTYTGTVTLLR